MDAIVIDGKLALRVAETPVPEPTPDQIRIKVAYVGICGSDLHYYFEGANGAFVVREPLVPGHELSALVDLDPKGELAPGTPVTIHPARFGTSEPGIEDRPHLWPGGSYLGSASTWPHTQGAMAQYLIVERSMVRVLPEGLPLLRAALAEPLAVVLHGMALAGGVEGASVLVSGAGPIGLLAAAAAKANGAAEVTSTDVLSGPLERARALGVDHTISVSNQTVPEMAYDLVIECSGVAAAMNTAALAVRRAGRLVQVGMVPNADRPLNLSPLISKEVRWFGSFRFRDEIDQAISLLAANPQFDSVITQVIPAAQAKDAFEVARDSQASGKVVVAMWAED